jgi:hypothetical protein
MSKAYLLVICLFFASLSGCITDDELEDKSATTEDDDMIEPVGMGNNETDDYDELVSEIANLTDRIEELNEQIDVLSEDLQSLETYRYNPEENSNITIPLSHNISMNITKMGNTIHITGPTYTASYYIWFIDNAGIEIMMNSMNQGYDRCYANGNWTSNSTEACTQPPEASGSVTYEFNLTREPLNVKIGYPYSFQKGQSFP